jgi:hypothetical protein
MIVLLYACFFVIVWTVLGWYRVHLQLSCLSGQLSYKMSICPWVRFLNFEFYKEKAGHFFGIRLARKKIFTKQVRLHSKDRTREETERPPIRSLKMKRSFHCYLKRFRHRFYPAVRAVIRSIQFRRLDLKGRMGFKTPAATGTVFGCVQSFQYLFSEKVSIDLEPDFSRQRSEYSLNLQLQCVLFVLLWRIMVSVVNAGWMYLKCKNYT